MHTALTGGSHEALSIALRVYVSSSAESCALTFAGLYASPLQDYGCIDTQTCEVGLLLHK